MHKLLASLLGNDAVVSGQLHTALTSTMPLNLRTDTGR